jgi:hypothetical protein
MAVELTTTVLNEVYQERRRQDDQWGVQDHPDGTALRNHIDAAQAKIECEEARRIYGVPTWMHILQEEAYEAFAEEEPAQIRAELIQVAAVAVAWIEAIDRRVK